MELIDIKIKWAAIGDIGNVGAAHGGELDFGNEECAENSGVVFANETFGEVYDEDFAFIHDFADIKGRFRLADDIANNRVGGEGADFVEDRSDGLVDLFFVPLTKFVFPELQYSDIFAVFESFFAEFFVGEQAGDIKQSGLWAVEQSE